MPDAVRDAIVREASNCDHYPDSFSRRLREKIAAFEKVRADWVFCGNGASDVIFRLPRAVQAEKVMLTAPTFSDYERAARSFGADVFRHRLSVTDGFTLDSSFINAVRREKPDMVFVCNPNNPTGKLTKTRLIKDLLNYCRQANAWLVVDECFLDFVEQAAEYTSKTFLKKYSNLVILKAFTKTFGLPGIRLGYALCADDALISSLYFHGADWPVSNLAQAAGIAALDGAESFIKQTVEYVSTERAAIEKELIRLGYKHFESKTNYVFLQNPYPYDLREELDKMGIRIRPCGNYHGLDESFYRIAVSTNQNNFKLISAIEEITRLL